LKNKLANGPTKKKQIWKFMVIKKVIFQLRDFFLFNKCN